jgi:hypothetical protein
MVAVPGSSLRRVPTAIYKRPGDEAEWALVAETDAEVTADWLGNNCGGEGRYMVAYEDRCDIVVVAERTLLPPVKYSRPGDFTSVYYAVVERPHPSELRD